MAEAKLITICPICKGCGMYSYGKPMTGMDGKMYMVDVPQYCSCELGQQLRSRDGMGANLRVTYG